MADIKLIALDLDGTLLTTDKKLTDRTPWYQGRTDNGASSESYGFLSP